MIAKHVALYIALLFSIPFPPLLLITGPWAFIQIRRTWARYKLYKAAQAEIAMMQQMAAMAAFGRGGRRR